MPARIVMCSRRASYKQAYRTLHEGNYYLRTLYILTLMTDSALPLFNATESFTNLLELYATCNCSPGVDHPAVRGWLGANYQHYAVIPAQPRSSAIVPSSPPRRATGAAQATPLPKQWTKAGNQAGHTLSSLRPVTLDG